MGKLLERIKTDRRKRVIKGIDICLQRFRCGEDCPYYNDAKIGCMEQLREDALAFLKEQEPVQTYKDDNGFSRCGSCNFPQSYGCKYCDNCGKPLKWELI